MSPRTTTIAATFLALASITSIGANVIASAVKEHPASDARALGRMPRQVADWHYSPPRDDMIEPVVVDSAFAEAVRMYDRIEERDYVSSGSRIMLNAAYLRAVRQEGRVHRPESCYSTQGFTVTPLQPVHVSTGDGNVATATTFVARREGRTELVAYWVRIGDEIPTGPGASRRSIFLQSLSPELPDSLLLRVSMIVDDQDVGLDSARRTLASFLGGLVKNSDPVARAMLVGAARPGSMV
jgi:EpsI family protein